MRAGELHGHDLSIVRQEVAQLFGGDRSWLERDTVAYAGQQCEVAAGGVAQDFRKQMVRRRGLIAFPGVLTGERLRARNQDGGFAYHFVELCAKWLFHLGDPLRCREVRRHRGVVKGDQPALVFGDPPLGDGKVEAPDIGAMRAGLHDKGAANSQCLCHAVVAVAADDYVDFRNRLRELLVRPKP